MDTSIENMKPYTFSPQKRAKSSKNVHCAVSGCDSTYATNTTVRFHQMPPPNKRTVYMTDTFGYQKQVDKLEAWKLILKINNVTSYTKVCSLHFKKEDYFFPDVQAMQRRLRQDAIPSCNLPGKKKQSEAHEARLRRHLKRNISSKEEGLELIKRQHNKSQVSSKLFNRIDENRFTYGGQTDFGIQNDQEYISNLVLDCEEDVTVNTYLEIQLKD